MNEICGRLDTYLSRFHAHRLGLVEENGRVFSDQLSLFQYLLSGKWQKVRVTNSPFTLIWGKDLFLEMMPDRLRRRRMPGISVR